MLIVDGGDFIGVQGEKARLDAEYTLKALMRMGYDAINLGERDFFQRVAFLTEKQKQYQLPFVSANIFTADGKTLLFQPYIIKELKSFSHNGKKIPALKVGIFGILFKRLQLVIDNTEPALVVGEPIEAAQRIVAELQNQCDVIIALAHIRYPQVKMLAEAVPEIDVIIASHDPIYRPAAEKYGNSIAIIGGNRGQYIGDLKLDFDHEKNIINFNGKVIMLNKDIEMDGDMSKLVGEFNREKSKVAQPVKQH